MDHLDAERPWFVDLDSPTFVELLAQNVRVATGLKMSEMLPALDETWLTDAAGRRYTSELRFVVSESPPVV